MNDAAIARAAAAPLDLELAEPFGIATGSLPRARNVLVTLELAGGVAGLGEAAPFPAVSGETQESTLAALQDVLPGLEGRDVRAWRPLVEALRRELRGAPAAAAAVEIALFDAFARRAGLALHHLLGGAGCRLETDYTLVTGGVAKAHDDAARARRRGFGVLKVKVGGAPLEDDAARVLAAREAAPDAAFVLDGNAAYEAGEAVALLAELKAHGLVPALFEQPVGKDDLAGLARVHRESGVPVAADESLQGPADALRLAREGAAQVLNVKLMKCGIVGALEICAIARAAGLGLMIGGMIESRLAMTAAACLAAGQGGFSFVDLDTPLFLTREPFEGGARYEGAIVDLEGVEEGHGVRWVPGDG